MAASYMTTTRPLSRAHRPTRGEIAKLHILRRVGLESVWGLFEACPVRTLAAGEVLLEAGQSNQTLFLVLEGRLSVHLAGPRTEPIAYAETGQSVGELSVIDDQPGSAWVVAAEHTRVLAVDDETFWRLVRASHEFSANMLMTLAKRMRSSNDTIVASSRLRDQFERDALVDGLTGVYNRRWLNERLPRLVARASRDREPVAVLMLDVDHFKRFNDRFGHAAGDHVLSVVAQTISAGVRPTDLVARFGGEEFVVLMPSTDLAGATVAAERVRHAVRSTPLDGFEGRLLPQVTVSIGVAQLGSTEDGPALMARADAALYHAKEAGRDRVERA